MWSSPLARDLFGWVYVRGGKSNIYLVSGFASLSLSLSLPSPRTKPLEQLATG